MKRTIVKSMLCEPNSNEWSSKRILGTIGTLSLIVNMFLCSIKGYAAPPDSIVSAIEFITIACMFGVASEKFANLRNAIRPSSNTVYQPENINNNNNQNNNNIENYDHHEA